MKRSTFSIYYIFIIITASIFNISCFERNDMYDFAKNGVKVIYAINISSDKVYKITEDGHYNKSYAVSTSLASSGVGFYPLDDKLIAVEADGTDIYFHTYDGKSWNAKGPHPVPNDLRGMFLMDNQIIYAEIYNIYSFNGDSWQTISGITTPASIMAMTKYKGDIYIFGSDFFIYRYTYSTAAIPINTGAITVGTTYNFFAAADGYVYIGYNNKFNYSKLGSASAYTVVSPTNVKAYAIYNSSAVYAAGYSSQIEIMKLESGTFNTIRTIPSTTTPAIVMKALSATKLVLGISASTSHDGLYILDTESGDMETLTTDAIGAINILNY